MSAKQAIQVGTKNVRPVLSLNRGEARARVLNLYKAWYRQIPYVVKEFDMPKSEDQCRAKLKEMFLNNKNVTDVRVIDMLVIKVSSSSKHLEIFEMLRDSIHHLPYPTLVGSV
ncbi:PREDICTED: NADH dehydrogenase [ubiquinone] 1 alpha subcomplex subunit 6-like [Papilio polytes]|uniref:NADH dehydrogenase [ubiquinone] 1 alpha subcomplex subunit 6-like n=1 Tax=Papilio polytes TaxID=76194 RepID=UPI000675D287|nr:PREDICTED: NADH dehydrogenase [ubiquinone] 1 alpha subcomplex subunit 6-like [Papilio polytes]